MDARFLAIIPGLKEACRREQLLRACAFVDVPWSISGFDIVPLTPRIRNELTISGNAFFEMKPITRNDVFHFIWRLSPHFKRKAGVNLLTHWRRWRIIRALKGAGFYLAINEILDWLKIMLQDQPALEVGDGSIPDVHWLAHLIDFNIGNYTMTIDEVMDTPFSTLYQLHRAYHISRGFKLCTINGADKIVSNFLLEQAKAGVIGKRKAQ